MSIPRKYLITLVFHYTPSASKLQPAEKGETKMDSEKAYFLLEDVDDGLPKPGYYESKIISARFRRSSNGNRMIQVIHCLDGVAPAHQTVADYFVLTGSSSSGIAMGRRRLVQLYRTCGLDPKQGEAIYPKVPGRGSVDGPCRAR